MNHQLQNLAKKGVGFKSVHEDVVFAFVYCEQRFSCRAERVNARQDVITDLPFPNV